MASTGSSGSLGTWHTTETKQQLAQYEGLARDFEELDQAIALLPVTQDSPFVAPSHYRPFLDIVYSDLSPDWTTTSRILSDIFGELGQATKAEVPMGYGGILALRRAVGRTTVDAEKVGEIRYWLFLVTISVYHTRDIIARNPITAESALPDNGAASPTRRSGSAPAPPIESTPSTRRQRATTPSPAKVETSPPLPNKGKGRAIEVDIAKLEVAANGSETASPGNRGIGPSPRVLRSRSSASRPRYEEEEDGEDEVEARLGSPLSSLADSEGDDQDSRDMTNDRERPRKKPRLSASEPSPTPNIAPEVGGGVELEEKAEFGVISSETKAKETADRNRFIARMPATTLTPEEWLVRDAFSSIPTEVDLSPAPTFDLPAAHSFRRRHLPGNGQITVYDGIGSAKNKWDTLRNNLCILSDMNLCCFASDDPKSSTPFRPGQPVVFTSHAKECLKVVEAISETGIRKHGKIKLNTGPVKEKPFIHLFVQATGNDWRYMGDYVVAWNGSDEKGNYQYLDPPSSTVHETLKEKLKDHATSKNQKGQWPETLLCDWDFKGKTWNQAKKELDRPNRDGKRRHVKFLVLKCIGWDETSFEEWSRLRAEESGRKRTKKGNAKNRK